MTRLYQYVGPPEIFEAIDPTQPGQTILSRDDLSQWLAGQELELDLEDHVTVTYVIDQSGILLIADRHSEHVACASGRPVLAAGELVLDLAGSVEVVEASNQSTGYCPEPECWAHVRAALERAGVPHPVSLSRPFVFRQCEACGQSNIVKEGWFECAVCGMPLSEKWNYAAQSAAPTGGV